MIKIEVSKLLWDNTVVPRIDRMDSLVESIKKEGFWEDRPIMVKKISEDYFLIVTGRRRAWAAVLEGIKEIPCEILAEGEEIPQWRYKPVCGHQPKKLTDAEKLQTAGLVIEKGCTKTQLARVFGRYAANKLWRIWHDETLRKEVLAGKPIK